MTLSVILLSSSQCISKIILLWLNVTCVLNCSIFVSVWLEFMLPLLPLRNYSKFVVDYLKSLLKLHNAAALGKVAKSQDGSRSNISVLHSKKSQLLTTCLLDRKCMRDLIFLDKGTFMNPPYSEFTFVFVGLHNIQRVFRHSSLHTLIQMNATRDTTVPIPRLLSFESSVLTPYKVISV